MELTLNRTDALKTIKCAPKGARFFVTARVDLPIPSEPDRVFPTCAGINVSRAQALRFVGNALSETLDERGGRICIRINKSESSMLDRTYYHIG